MRHDLTIKAEIKGGQFVSGKPHLQDVIAMCKSLLDSLKQIERCVTNKTSKIEYVIEKAETGSLLLDVKPEYDEDLEKETVETVTLFRSTVNRLESGDPIDPRIDDKALRSLKKLTAPLKGHAATLSIGGVSLTSNLVENINGLLGNSYSAIGSVMGVVEKIDIHSRNIFSLFPLPTEKQISCHFEIEHLDKIREAIGRKVTVYGHLKYDHNGAYPRQVKMLDLDVHPLDNELPSFESLRGCIKGTEGIYDCDQECD